MALTTTEVPPLDPNLYTGPTRKITGPARTANVTPDVAYGEYCSWLYVGTTGNVSFVQWDGTNQTLTGLLAGMWHPIHSIMVNSSGTTATNIVRGS